MVYAAGGGPDPRCYRVNCDKLPAVARTAQEQALAATRSGWELLRDPDVPAEAKKAAADACRDSERALTQASAAAGCK